MCGTIKCSITTDSEEAGACDEAASRETDRRSVRGKRAKRARVEFGRDVSCDYSDSDHMSAGAKNRTPYVISVGEGRFFQS